MRKKLDRRKKYTRKVLKESLIALLAEDKPISAVTAKRNCERRISIAPPLHAFSDPYDLLDHIESEIIEDMVAH